MRNLLSAVVSLLLCSCLAKNEPAGFAKANALLARTENHKAQREYQALLRQGIKRSEVYCNLGNALLKDGHPGLAVVAYEKGLLAAPEDSQIHRNELVALRGSAHWPAAGREVSAGIRERLAPACDAAVAAAMGMLLVSCVLTCLAARSPRPAAKTKLLAWAKGIAGSFGVLILLSTSLLLSRSYAHQAIVLKDTPGRSGPSTNAAKAAEFYLGEKVAIKNQFQDWVKVRRENGEESWLAGAEVAQLND